MAAGNDARDGGLGDGFTAATALAWGEIVSVLKSGKDEEYWRKTYMRSPSRRILRWQQQRSSMLHRMLGAWLVAPG